MFPRTRSGSGALGGDHDPDEAWSDITDLPDVPREEQKLKLLAEIKKAVAGLNLGLGSAGHSVSGMARRNPWRRWRLP